jgi:hypothetical protein
MILRALALASLASCAFDQSGLPATDGGQVATDGAAPSDGTTPFDAHPTPDTAADAPLFPDATPDAELPDAAPAVDACVDVVCSGEDDCPGQFSCCHLPLGVCAEGLWIGGEGCVPADDWLACP